MEFNASRLKIARKRRKLSCKGLADRLHVTSHTISRWEGGLAKGPSPEVIQMLSRVLEFPEKFFLGGDIEIPESQRVSFRNQASMSSSIREAALAAVAVGFIVSDWFSERFTLPEPSVPNLGDVYDAEHAARVLRAHWHIGERPISNLVHLLESKGVRVFSLAENTVELDACSLWREGRPYIFLNSCKTGEQVRFDAAHELGHLVLHQDGGVEGRLAEEQANAFALSFLMPKCDVLAQCDLYMTLSRYVQMKSRWLVPTAALIHRVYRLGLMSDMIYHTIVVLLAKNYGIKEPFPIDRERSIVWEKVLRIMWSRKLSLSKIAARIGIPEKELEDLLFFEGRDVQSKVMNHDATKLKLVCPLKNTRFVRPRVIPERS